MTSEDPDEIIARIRADVPILAGQLEALAAQLRLLSESLSADQRSGPPVPDEELPGTSRPVGPAPDDSQEHRPPSPVPDADIDGAADLDGDDDDLDDLDDLDGDDDLDDLDDDFDEDADEGDAASAEPVNDPQQVIPTRRSVRTALPKFFAVAGSAVTLVGVASVLLPAGGAVPGQFARATIGLVLAALAVAAAVWQHRIDPRNIGARALLATGLASAFLCLLALAARFVDDQGQPLVALVPGLVMTGLVGIAGLWTARRWRSQGVAIVAALGGLLVAPVMGLGPADGTLAIVALMVILTLAAGMAQLGLGWVGLLLARAGPTVLYITWVAASPSVFRWGPGLSVSWSTGVAVLLVAVLALGTLAPSLLHRSGTWRERVVGASGLVALSAPLMVVAQTQEIVAPAAVGCLVVGVVFLAGTVWGIQRRSAAETLVTGALLGALFLVLGVLVALDRQYLGYLPWGLAVPCLALAERSRSSAVLVAGSLLGVVGLLWWLPALPVLLDTPFVDDVAGQGVERVVQSLLGVAVAVVANRAYRTFFPAHRTRVLDLAWSGAVVVGSVAVVLTGSLVGSSAGDTARGFRVAHVLVTIGLAVLCIVLVSPALQAGRGRRARARLAAGLAVTAMAKLFLFDTQALPGLWRAAAFLAVGILLLVVGTWYYRQLERGRRPRTGPAGPAPEVGQAGRDAGGTGR